MSLSELFTRDAKGWFIVWDVSDPETFDSINDWETVVRNKTDDGDIHIPIYLVGNKCDLLDGNTTLIITL